MILPTFSALGRAEACESSAEESGINTVTVYSIRGTDGHSKIANGIKGLGDPGPWLPTVEAVKTTIGEEPTYVSLELALAYNPDSDKARTLGEDIGRGYEKAGADLSEEFCGSADLVCIKGSLVSPGLATIVDFKTGKAAGDPWQLDAQAIAVARAYGVNRVRVAFWYVSEDAAPVCDTWRELGPMELDAIAARLRSLAARLRGAVRSRTSGSHCTYCNNYAACPATASLALALVREEGFTELSAETAPAAWVALERAKVFLERVKEKLEQYAEACPFELEDGRIVKAVTTERESINGPVAFAALSASYGAEAAALACPPSTSKEQLKRALGKDAKQALEVIGEAGGIEVKSYQTVKAVRPR